MKTFLLFAFLMVLSLRAFATNSFQTIAAPDPSPFLYANAYRGFEISSGLVTVAGTSETTFLYIKNPSTNTRAIRIVYRQCVETVSGHSVLVNFYSNPTCSANGTAASPNNVRINSASPASPATAFTGPTCSANGTLIGALDAGNAMATSVVPLVIDPNNTVLATVQVSNASDKVLCDVFYAEE